MSRVFVVAALGFVPLGVLVAAYVAVAVSTANAWPWLEIVHEDGQRTLLLTLAYFEHASRELPLDALLGLGIGCAAAGCASRQWPRVRSELRPRGLLAVLIPVLVISVGALATVGPAETLSNLLQEPTRPGEPPAWGAHWRYHLVSRFALLCAAYAAASWLWTARDGWTPRRAVPFLLVLALFVLSSLVFGVTAEPFTDPRFLGHQAREVATHGVLTLPIALLACERVLRSHAAARRPGPRLAWPALDASSAGILALALAVGLGFGALLGGAKDMGQTSDLTPLLAGHVFEHGLSYWLTAAVARSALLSLLGPHRSLREARNA